MKLINTPIRIVTVCLIVACNQKQPTITPDIITEKVPHDTDDPAIWIHPTDPTKSIIFGTDKDTQGAIYAFDLNGKIIQDKVITNIKYPNNIDVEYGLQLNDSTKVDIIAFTEREKSQIRIFSVPDMQPLDQGGFPVFVDENNPKMRLPMGIALYKNPKNQHISAIVSRKQGSTQNYLYQYHLQANATGLDIQLLRKFGKFSQHKEIEAIAIDDTLGFVYYSDEGIGIRKYHADPSNGNDEIAMFGGEYFTRDIEGIALVTQENDKGFLIVSDQQAGQFNIFSRQDNRFIKAINLSTTATDGCDVVNNIPLNKTFAHGLFVAMNEGRDFYLFDIEKLGLP